MELGLGVRAWALGRFFSSLSDVGGSTWHFSPRDTRGRPTRDVTERGSLALDPREETEPPGVGPRMAAAEAPARGSLVWSRGAGDSPGGGGGAGAGEDEAFRFEARRARLDWRLLHAVDVDRMMRENDIDVLESTLAGGKGGKRSRLSSPFPVSWIVILFFSFNVSLHEKKNAFFSPRDGESLREWMEDAQWSEPAANPAPQETVAFGDVTVEDSRNLTTNNSRKIIRLAQCQVEYLLHVQETLVRHKERLRRVAEHAQREAMDAKAKVRPRGARRGARGATREVSRGGGGGADTLGAILF